MHEGKRNKTQDTRHKQDIQGGSKDGQRGICFEENDDECLAAAKGTAQRNQKRKEMFEDSLTDMRVELIRTRESSWSKSSHFTNIAKHLCSPVHERMALEKAHTP